MKINKSCVLLFLVMILGTGLAEAASPRVGYIYYSSSKIDANIASYLNSFGLEVEIVPGPFESFFFLISHINHSRFYR